MFVSFNNPIKKIYCAVKVSFFTVFDRVLIQRIMTGDKDCEKKFTILSLFEQF